MYVGLLFMEMLLAVLLAFVHSTWTATFCDGRSAGAIAKVKSASAVALPFATATRHIVGDVGGDVGGGGGGGGRGNKTMPYTHKRATSDPLQQGHTLLAKRVSSVV